jgi:hypothetical protein
MADSLSLPADWNGNSFNRAISRDFSLASSVCALHSARASLRTKSIQIVGLLAIWASLGIASVLGQEPAGTESSSPAPSVEINLKLLPSAPEQPEKSAEEQKATESKEESPKVSEKDGKHPKADEGDTHSESTVGIRFQPLRRPSKENPESDQSGECPGGVDDPEAVGDRLEAHPDDVPLEQEEHPFDVPAAKATSPERRFLKVSQLNDDVLDVTEEETQISDRIADLLQYYRDNPENVARRGPWALMHAILPYGVETEAVAGNRKVNAIGWLCHNGVSGRQRMFQSTKSGFRPNIGPGVQGHEGQFLAILAQSHVQPDYPLQIGRKKYRLMDLVRYEMATCREKTELTFKLIGLSHYLQPNQTWRDNRGRTWSIEKMVAEELAQPITGAACGGTHRLMGLSCAVIRRQEAGLPITGHFRRAEIFLDDFVAYALTMQNPDGSFSTEWFERRADEPNIERKIQTTGHILEWLVYTVPEEQLHRPEILLAVEFLVNALGEEPEKDWPIGPRGHSLRALSLYQQRIFHTTTAEPSESRLANERATEASIR